MTRRLTSFILCAALLLMLCGCGSLFDKDYSRETDYVSSGDAGSDGKSQVKNYYGLKQAILQLVETHGTVKPPQDRHDRIGPSAGGGPVFFAASAAYSVE